MLRIVALVLLMLPTFVAAQPIVEPTDSLAAIAPRSVQENPSLDIRTVVIEQMSEDVIPPEADAQAACRHRGDAMLNGALIALGAVGILDNVVAHWILDLHRAVPGEHALEVELGIVFVSAVMLAVGIQRERRAPAPLRRREAAMRCLTRLPVSSGEGSFDHPLPGMPLHLPSIVIEYPGWVAELDWKRTYRSDDEKMLLAVEVARQNVLQEGGGPFGAGVFERESGRLISVGMNLVVPLHNSSLHGEIVAFMMAQQRVESFSLGAPGLPPHELATSCEPCAMCLGATLWSGVTRVICGATREDAQRLQFDEGPVFPQSYAYMEERGVEFAFEVRRREAAEVMELYLSRSGVIYNG